MTHRVRIYKCPQGKVKPFCREIDSQQENGVHTNLTKQGWKVVYSIESIPKDQGDAMVKVIRQNDPNYYEPNTGDIGEGVA